MGGVGCGEHRADVYVWMQPVVGMINVITKPDVVRERGAMSEGRGGGVDGVVATTRTISVTISRPRPLFNVQPSCHPPWA